MSHKAAVVFWIGLILIGLNFWLSGQSTVVWSLFTGKSSSSSGPPVKLLPLKPGSPKPNG